jgi:cytochrome P450
VLSNVIFGGLDTVASALSFMARCLAENPQLRAQLATDRSLIPAAIEEFLRRFGIPNTARVITHDFEYKGVSFRKGEQILLSKTLHSLDERRFPDPLQVNLKRLRRSHDSRSVQRRRYASEHRDAPCSVPRESEPVLRVAAEFVASTSA